MEVADTFGNLLSRCVGKSLNKNQCVPKTPSDLLLKSQSAAELLQLLRALSDECSGHYSSANFNRGLEAIMKCLRTANLFVQTEKPWELVKQQNQEQRLEFCLYLALESCRVCAILLQPIIPEMSSVALDKLNVKTDERLWRHASLQLDNSMPRPLGTGTAVICKKIKE